MFKKGILILILLFTLFSFTDKHEYYLSVTKVEYVEEQNSLQFVSRIFIDDFEKLLRERYDQNITLNQNGDPEIVDTLIEEYLGDKILVLIDGRLQKFTFIGKEYKDDIMVVYLEITGITKINTIELSNKVLFELFEEQRNIMRTKIYDQNRTFVLVRADDKGILNF